MLLLLLRGIGAAPALLLCCSLHQNFLASFFIIVSKLQHKFVDASECIESAGFGIFLHKAMAGRVRGRFVGRVRLTTRAGEIIIVVGS